MKEIEPNYKRIYSDLIEERFSDRTDCKKILSKKKLSQLDVIKLNSILFKNDSESNFSFNQMHRSYNRETILEILTYQKQNNLSNVQLAAHFQLSRNTVAKWKKIFLV